MNETDLYYKSQQRTELCVQCRKYYANRQPDCPYCRSNKKCKHCNIPKNLDEFSRSNSSTDGHSNVCKLCDQKRSQQIRLSIKNGTVDYYTRSRNRTTQCNQCSRFYSRFSKTCPHCRVEKYCNVCGILKELKEFYPKTDAIDGCINDCINCVRGILSYCRNYNITKEKLLQLRETSQNRCAICHEITELHLDHNHNCCSRNGRSCGKCIRSFLCRNCNQGLGNFKDDITKLESAISYLRRFQDG